MQTAAALMSELADTKARSFARRLLSHVEELAAPLCWLEDQLRPARAGLETETERLILWAWQHQQLLVLLRRRIPRSVAANRACLPVCPVAVSPYLLSGGVLDKLYASVFGDAPGDAQVVAPNVSALLESPRVPTRQAGRTIAVGSRGGRGCAFV